MTGPLRNRQGCWTCRLRKKKCDESRPQCTNCQTLLITCYGYGPKPDWVDNGEKEKAVVNSLKDIVKHTSRRKASVRSSKVRDPVVRIEPKFASLAVDESASDSTLSQESGNNIQHASVNTTSSSPRDLPEVRATTSISADDSILLMHFVDHVFPLQYPMYKPEASMGGRGWLLALLLRTQHLYHAALALSACHRRTIMSAETGRVLALVQQEENLEICLRLLSTSAQNSCAESGLSILSSIIEVAFFDLVNGNDSAWKTHLGAAITMYQRGLSRNLVQLGLSDKTRAFSFTDVPPPENDSTVAEEVASLRFLGGTIIWLDIISSITTGKSPLLLTHHAHILSDGSQIQLRDIMGCQNWAMHLIARVSDLHERKIRAIQQNRFDCAEFESVASTIRLDIQSGHSQSDLSSPEAGCNRILDTTQTPHIFVTQAFTYMATIYLHLVMYGFLKPELLDITISNAMAMLRTQIPHPVLSALIPPFFVIGVASSSKGDQQFFRDILSSLPLLDPFLGHRARLLPVLEEIWRTRAGPGLGWQDCLGLSNDILLV